MFLRYAVKHFYHLLSTLTRLADGFGSEELNPTGWTYIHRIHPCFLVPPLIMIKRMPKLFRCPYIIYYFKNNINIPNCSSKPVYLALIASCSIFVHDTNSCCYFKRSCLYRGRGAFSLHRHIIRDIVPERTIPAAFAYGNGTFQFNSQRTQPCLLFCRQTAFSTLHYSIAHNC